MTVKSTKTWLTGTTAVLAVFILQIPELGTESIGDALEWVFFIILPNFCFSKALQDINVKHVLAGLCDDIFKKAAEQNVDSVQFCELVEISNRTIPCCLSKFNSSVR